MGTWVGDSMHRNIALVNERKFMRMNSRRHGQYLVKKGGREEYMPLFLSGHG